MPIDQISALLQQQLPDCDITVSGEGSHFEITAVGDVFKGLRALKRQQLVYSILSESITSGAVHAVNMHLYDRDQWAEKNG